MTLPLQDFPIFIYSFFGVVIATLFIVKSVSVGIDTFKKGADYAS